MKIKQLIQNKYLHYALLLFGGLMLGWLIFGGSGSNDKPKEHTHQQQEKQTWTCSMHPQIKQDKPGKCPICGMDLILLKTASFHTDGAAADPNGIPMSDEAIALANIQTTVVETGNTQKSVRLYGSIQADERHTQTQSSYVSGRIERLLVNFVGESIRQGQTIATIYSPELLNAQQELIEASKLEASQPYLLQAARQKLRYLNMPGGQIDRIEKSGKVSPVLEIKSNTNGILVEKNLNQGDYVNQGTVMFKVANLSQVWAMFDAYESDLPFLKVGEQVSFTLQAFPGKTFSGKISFIDPIVDKTTRTAKVRVETANPGLQLKPEMYATATVNSSLKQYHDKIVIPKSSILWTGKRSIVYVKQQGISSPVFSLREVELGPSLGNAFVILSGLAPGDEIVTNGVFAVDASAQLEGKPSMMNQHEGLGQNE